MKKRSLTTLLFISLLSVFIAQAADFDVRRYGAKGDGKKKNTVAIQKAIDACHKAGGGRVVLADGIYMTAPIQLKTGVNLYIDSTARLLASPDIDDYANWKNVNHVITENLPRKKNACLIFADEADNIAITGSGTIDGNGTYHFSRSDKRWFNDIWTYERIFPEEKQLPRVVFFAGCKDVVIEDVTMTNQPAGWGYLIHDCDRVTIRGLKIMSDIHVPNNDGIHINCSRDVNISDCNIVAGDDAIILRANSRSLKENKPTERVTVSNCVLQSAAHAIRFGWVNDGVIRNCQLSDIVITKTFRGIGIELPSSSLTPTDYGREATVVEDISLSNITMTDIITYPIYIIINADPKTKAEAIRNIHFSNMQVTGAHFPYLHGREDCVLQNFVFDNCTFTRETTNKVGDNIFSNTDGFVFNATTFNTRSVNRKEYVRGLQKMKGL